MICRPYLEARRPPAFIALLLGVAIGPSFTGLLDRARVASFDPLLALASGWLALLAADSWDLGTLRRIGARRLTPMLAVTATAAAALAVGIPLGLGLMGAPPPWTTAVIVAVLACAAAAVDPAAARLSLEGAARPDNAARQSPSVASLSLGASLTGTALVAGLMLAAGADGAPPIWLALRHALMTLALGVAAGLVYVGPSRLLEGRGPLLTLTLTLPLVGWGVALWLGMSPMALLFAAGVVLANDATRRDLTFSLLREMERPFSMALLILAGASLTLNLAAPSSPALWAAAAILALARPLSWRLLPAARLRPQHALALSPLAIPMALHASSGSQAPYPLPGVIVALFVLSEIAWLLVHRANPAPGGRA